MLSTSEQIQVFLSTYKKGDLKAIQQRADAGEQQAQFQLGVLYTLGKGVTFDIEQATMWLTKASELGERAAMTLLGRSIADDVDHPDRIHEAIEWYLQAAESGDSDAQCALADIYATGRPGVEVNPKAMLHWYQLAADQHHPKALYTLGKLLIEGKLIQQNDEAAFRWFTLAIANGSEPAQKELEMLSARLGSAQIQQFKDRMMGEFQQH